MQGGGALLTLAAIGSIGICGCSFVFAKGPPDEPRSGSVDCTNSETLPVVDTVLGIGLGIAGVFAIASPPSNPQTFLGSGGDNYGPAVGGIVQSILFLSSAAYGFHKVSACRDAIGAERVGSGGTTGERDREIHVLATQGVAAAVRGDCPIAIAVGKQLGELDKPVLDQYVHSSPVAACIGAATKDK
jgi:hypothetical protein